MKTPFSAVLLTALGIVLAVSASGCIEITMPKQGAVVLGDFAHVVVEQCSGANPEFTVELDGKQDPTPWKRGLYADRWVADLPLEREGMHHLVIRGTCGNISGSLERDFTSRHGSTIDLAEKLSHHYMASHPATELGWDWGEAVFLYGLTKLGTHSDYLLDYERRWMHKGTPDPDRSDLCPPALGSIALARDFGATDTLSNAQRVARYIETEPRNRIGALNHLGHSFLNHLFPDSIWVDSLMMIGVFSAQWANLEHDPALLSFAAAQPLIYASVLQDSETGLFRHAWLSGSGSTIPEKKVFWLRGNAWVLAATVDILDELPADDPRREPLIELLRKTAAGFARFQMSDGWWDTVVNLPGRGYAEASGTALAAYALARGAHRGWLDDSYLVRAKLAFKAVTETLDTEKDGVSMPGISGPTNPMYSAEDYAAIGVVSDKPYGIGAYLMAASELRADVF